MHKTYGLKRCGEASSELIQDAMELFHDTAWHTEKTARGEHQKAIYKVSECLSCNMLRDQVEHPRLKELGREMAKQVMAMNLVPADCIPIYSELNILLPMSSVAWHHDRTKRHAMTYRVSLPLTDEPDIDYCFTSWAAHTPVGVGDFIALNYRARDMRSYKMQRGHFHLFNNRVPHATVSKSQRLRPMLLVDFAPAAQVEQTYFSSMEFAPVSADERLPLLE
ncbi:hypothetical protein NHH82_20880 [Oxalobacteraceae bacterium OTU3REALA1]|nr:hypothetical protein NHH82_20880 [Oxalobacteraceae bacterium OTU3REALA1]